jgi:aspartokinase
MIVTKFGGTSMADAAAICKVAAILRENVERKVCVVSAPGRLGVEPKITDLLYEYNTEAVRHRFLRIITELNLQHAVVEYLDRQLSLRGKSTHVPTRLSLECVYTCKLSRMGICRCCGCYSLSQAKC